MTQIYSIKIGNASVKQWVQFAYEFTLNGVSNGQIALDGVSENYFNEFDINKEILIYKGGILKLKGLITSQNSLSAGGIVLTFHGIEINLVDNKAPMIGSELVRTWISINDETIFSTLVTSVLGWNVDITNSTGVTVDSFRVGASESVWNSIIRLIEQTGKDIFIDQENKKVYLYDELKRNNKFSFIEGKNAKNITREKSRSLAGKVIVYGKGDGNLQIVGSHGTGTPVEVIIDRNIVSNNEANSRALKAYNRLNPNKLSYIFEPININNDLKMGDSGNIINNSAKINETVDIVRLKTLVNGIGTEKYTIEVTNPQYRIASRNEAEHKANENAVSNQNKSTMQGSGNLSQWGNANNGNNSIPLLVNFNVDASHFQDEAGNIRVKSMTIDYDVDKFKQGFGDVTGTSDLDVDNDSGNTIANIDNSSDNNTTLSVVAENDSTDSSFSVTTSWNDVASYNNISANGDSIVFYAHLWVFDNTNPTNTVDYRIRIYNNDTGVYYPSSSGIRICRGFIEENTSNETHNHDPLTRTYFLVSDDGVTNYLNSRTADDTHNHIQYYQPQGSVTIICPVNPYLYDFEVQLICGSGTAISAVYTGYHVQSRHQHNAGGYATESHDHLSGSYNVPSSELGSIIIGDGVGEGAGVNATSVNIYLDYYDGSSWVNKHSVLSTGNTLDTDVDITNGGIYPDSIGLWRTRIYTNNTNADLIQAIIKVKHELDN